MTEEEIMMRSGMIQPQPVVQPQQPNLFAQQKAANYPNSENLAQFGKETNKMAQKYAPTLIGQQPKTNEQVVTDRALQQTQNFNAPSTYKAPEPTKKVVDASDPNAGMEALLYTSPEEEERLRKASVQRQRIMAIGDALRHIGNIYNTVNYAPSQQFNNPVEDERRRYLQEKAYRDQNNYKYMTYQQAKAAQDAKQKQWEHDYALKMADAARKAGYTEAQIKNMQDRLAQQKAYQQEQINLGKRRADDAKAYNDARLKESSQHNRRMEGIAGMNAKTARDRATAYINHLGKGGNASSMPLQTPNGSIHAPGKSIPQPQMNQMYKWAIDNGYIKQSDFQKKMAEAGFGKADPDYVRNQMVAEAMMEHGELADYARDNYGWTYGSGNDGGLSIGWDDDEEDNGLSIGW